MIVSLKSANVLLLDVLFDHSQTKLFFLQTFLPRIIQKSRRDWSWRHHRKRKCSGWCPDTNRKETQTTAALTDQSWSSNVSPPSPVIRWFSSLVISNFWKHKNADWLNIMSTFAVETFSAEINFSWFVCWLNFSQKSTCSLFCLTFKT